MGHWSLFPISSALRPSGWTRWRERRQTVKQGILTSLGLYSYKLHGTIIKSFCKIETKLFILVGGRAILRLEVSRGWGLAVVLLNAEVQTLSWRWEACSEKMAIKILFKHNTYLHVDLLRGTLIFIWGLHNLCNTHNEDSSSSLVTEIYSRPFWHWLCIRNFKFFYWFHRETQLHSESLLPIHLSVPCVSIPSCILLGSPKDMCVVCM